MLGANADYLLPTDCARRIVAEVQGALDSCAERQRQLERSLRVSRRLLQVWEPARALAPEPETKEEAPTPACTPSAQDLRELELLTQALEKAVRVRKGPSKAGQRDSTPSLTSASHAAASGATAPTHSQPSSQAGSRASGARSTKGAQRATIPAKDYPKGRPLSRGDRTHMRTGSQAAGPGSGLRDQQMAPSAVPRATEPFTLKDRGTLLQLPAAFRKAAFQNSRLWAQLSAVQASDSTDATRAAKAQFLQKLQLASGCSSHRPGAAEVEAHAQSLRKACTLLRLHMQKALSAAPTDWTQEYRCLLVLEGLQAIVGQCLHRIQALQTAVTGGLPGPRLVEKPSQASSLCGGKMDPSWSPELLLYSSTKELQTVATLKLRVAMLDQQIRLEKVLMAELLPLINTQEPGGPPWLALCRAAYSLLCEGDNTTISRLRTDLALPTVIPGSTLTHQRSEGLKIPWTEVAIDWAPTGRVPRSKTMSMESQNQEEAVELPGILVSSPRQGLIVPDVTEQGVTCGGHPYHRHPHSRPGSRPPSRKHENIKALAQAHPARPGVHRVPWSPAHPFLGHRRCRGLLAALRPALRRTGGAGRCSWHGITFSLCGPCLDLVQSMLSALGAGLGLLSATFLCWCTRQRRTGLAEQQRETRAP